MKQKCIEAVRAAASARGLKRVTDADLRDIEERLTGAMRKLERTDPRWPQRADGERMQRAVDWAGADIRSEAASKATNQRAQLAAQADLQAIEAQMAQLRPTAERPPAITGKLSYEREVATLKEARQAFYRASGAAYEARVIDRNLVGDLFVDAATLAARAVRRGMSPGRVKQLQEDAQYASLAMRAAETRRNLAALQAEPRAGMPEAPLPVAIKAPVALADLPGAQDLARLASQMPDLEVAFAGEEVMRLRDVMQRIDAEHQQDAHWAELVRVAAECAMGS